MLPSCPDGHATPGHEERRQRSFHPPLYPPAPADTRDGVALARIAAALARVAVLWVHACTQDQKRKKALAGK